MILEQSIRTNGIIETSRPINPDPIQEAQHTEELQRNPPIDTNLVLPKERLSKKKKIIHCNQ